VAALLVALLLVAPLSAARDPSGPPERVSPADGLSHIQPAVAADVNGAVVVWQGQAGSPPSYEIFARRYNRDGSPLGPAFQVNESTAGDQRRPAVALLAGGGFVVAWDSFAPSPAPGEGRQIYLRRFDAGGAPLAGDERANARADGGRYAPALAAAPAGGFALAWHGAVSGDDDGVAFRRFDAGGAPLDAAERLPYGPEAASADQSDAALAFDDSGALAIAWESYSYEEATDKAVYSVAASRYAASGAALATARALATGGDVDAPCDPAVAAGLGGRAVVAWASAGGIYLARLDAPGGTLTVSPATAAPRTAPAVALDSDGAGLVAWADRATRSTGRLVGLAARELDPAGTPVGGELYPGLPAPYTVPAVGAVAVAAAHTADGPLVVVWQNEEAGASGVVGSIYLRHYPGAESLTPLPTPSGTAAAPSETAAPTGETPGPTSETAAPASATPAPPRETATPTSGTPAPTSHTPATPPPGLAPRVYLPFLPR